MWEGKGGCGGKEGEMTQILYAHMNKRKNFKKRNYFSKVNTFVSFVISVAVFDLLEYIEAILKLYNLTLFP
jgi:hypothetical protein